tara:strand:- start:2958 stop:3092 length:135 start_codon:yes stop_codon:yes gene_type:complete
MIEILLKDIVVRIAIGTLSAACLGLLALAALRERLKDIKTGSLD